jgi:hypothetical protein
VIVWLKWRIGCASALTLIFVACADEETPRIISGCRIVDATAVEADDLSLGFSARQVAENARTQSETLVFGTDRRPGPSVDLQVGIEDADFTKAEWVRESYLVAGDFNPACPQAITFLAKVRFRTSDSQFDERLAVQVWATAANAARWNVDLPLDGVAGSFQLEWPLPWDSTSGARGTTPLAVRFHGRIDPSAGSWGEMVVVSEWPQGAERTARLAAWGDWPPLP